MRQERMIGLLHQFKINAMMILHEETLLDLQEDMVEHILSLIGKVKFHGGIILNRCRFAAFVEFLKVATRKQEKVVAIHPQLCTALPQLLRNLHRFLAHIHFPKVIAFLK